VNAIRTLLAAASVAAILTLGAVVAFAAPGSVAKTASPSASAARAVYCPPEEKARRRQALKAFEKQMLAQRKAFFKTHPKAKARTAFVKSQNAARNRLVRAYAACE
jgi:hypothetical protein